jgi:excinuclease ABC subunit C
LPPTPDLPPIVGLAKRDEELWLPQAREPIRLPRSSEALRLLQFVRDECHRFATGLNQRLRAKDLRFKALESVEGIGPRRAAAIMAAYATLEAVAAASPEDIALRCSLPPAAARSVHAAARLTLSAEVTPRTAPAARSSAAIGETLADEAFASEAASPEPEYGE